jgi:hypothetical protein
LNDSLAFFVCKHTVIYFLKKSLHSGMSYDILPEVKNKHAVCNLACAKGWLEVSDRGSNNKMEEKQ